MYNIYTDKDMYGYYRNYMFRDIYEDADDFKTRYKASAFYTDEIKDDKIVLIYNLLLARYAHDAIASAAPGQFESKMFMLIWQHAPAWLKELELQKEIRTLTLEDLQKGSVTVINNALNPEELLNPSMDAFDPLTYINNQTASATKRSPADALALQLDLITRDVTEAFISKFKKLFLTVVEPEIPKVYWAERE